MLARRLSLSFSAGSQRKERWGRDLQTLEKKKEITVCNAAWNFEILQTKVTLGAPHFVKEKPIANWKTTSWKFLVPMALRLLQKAVVY